MTIRPVLRPDHDAVSLRGLMDHFAAAATGPTPQNLAEGFDKLSPQQKAHEYNLDAAQKEMDRRDAEGEDMTGAKIDKKTYKIIKPKQQGVAEDIEESIDPVEQLRADIRRFAQ